MTAIAFRVVIPIVFVAAAAVAGRPADERHIEA